MKDIDNLIVEKSKEIKNKNKEIEELKNLFKKKLSSILDISKIYGIKISNKTEIHLTIKYLNNYGFDLIIKTRKGEKEHKLNVLMKESLLTEEALNLTTSLLNSSIRISKEIDSEDIHIFIKEYNKIYSAINRLKNALKKLKKDKENEANSDYIDSLKLFLSSEKEIIKKDKEDFEKNKEHEKLIVYYNILDWTSGKRIDFNVGKLHTKNEGKKRFYFNSKFISKKEAMEILEYQVFNKGFQVEKLEKIPFYEKKESYYGSQNRSWNIYLDDYLSKSKKLLMTKKIISF